MLFFVLICEDKIVNASGCFETLLVKRFCCETSNFYVEMGPSPCTDVCDICYFRALRLLLFFSFCGEVLCCVVLCCVVLCCVVFTCCRSFCVLLFLMTFFWGVSSYWVLLVLVHCVTLSVNFGDIRTFWFLNKLGYFKSGSGTYYRCEEKCSNTSLMFYHN